VRALIIGGVVLAGAVLWLAFAPTSRPAAASVAPAVAKAAPAQHAAAPAPTVAVETPAGVPADELAKALDSHKLDTRSDLFMERKNEIIPSRIYAEAAKCYRGQADRDQKIKVEFRLRVEDGEVSVSDVHVLKNTLTDASLSRCIVDEVRKARFKDPEMPDWESTEELLMRMRGFKKYASAGEPGEDDPG
jgi:hypothetical protein